MESVIDINSISKHKVQKYNFKILSSQTYSESPREDKNQEENIQKEEAKEIDQKEAQEIKDDFIAELLEKSDKMSSDIIKLQMQIEEGQKEFETRIAAERERSLKEGEEIGYKKAKEELEKSYEEIKKQYLNSIKKMDEVCNKFENFMQNLKDELRDTVFEIVKEITLKEVSQDSKEIAYGLINELIKEIKDAGKISIKVNPKDYEYIKDKFNEQSYIAVSKDEAVSEGGVILLSDMGNLDGDIKTRLEKAKQLITERV